MTPFTLHRPSSLSQAKALFESGSAWLAGGHALIPALKAGEAAHETLIDLSALAELQGVSLEGAHIRIGAMIRHATLLRTPLLATHLPGLVQMLGQISDPQVRNRATIGGSAATHHPASDYPPALLALDAVIETTHGAHAIDDFFIAPFETALCEGELITAVRVRIPQASGYAKFKHPASRYALAGVYVARYPEGHRVGVAGAARIACRWPQAEAALDAGATLDDLHLEGVALAADLHGSADYRAHLTGVLLREVAASL